MKKIIKYSEFLADAKTRKSMIYRPGLECVYDSGALPTPLTLPEGSIMHLQNELSAHDVPGTINDWLVDPKALSEAQVRYMIQEALASWGGEDPRIKELDADNLAVGDMLFYDRQTRKYCTVKHAAVGAVLADYDKRRYETNYDTYVGTFNEVAHFVGMKDAMASNPLYGDTIAATSCFYRIEFAMEDEFIVEGSIKFSATSGNGSIPDTTIMWGPGESLQEILNRFKDVETDSITFSALADGSGVGLEIGGYGANTMTVTDSTACEVIDCSGFAFYFSQNPSMKVGDDFYPSSAHTYIGLGAHHNWRGATASSILTGKGLVEPRTSCLGNTDKDYSYRSGINFTKFKSWASTNGDATFCADGVNGTTNSSSGKIMNKTTFDNNVNSSATADSAQAKLYEYYNHLFSDQTGDYAELRQTYEARYGAITDLYDAYLMSHCIKIDANSGITYAMMNRGDHQTEVKADVANVNYNYKVIPAYPPEYNAKQYGIADSEGFAPGRYYHPEPGDLGLFLRDDIMALVNANIALAEGGLALDNSTYRGSSADYSAHDAWYFHGTNGCLTSNTRYASTFRCRPSLALPLPN